MIRGARARGGRGPLARRLRGGGSTASRPGAVAARRARDPRRPPAPARLRSLHDRLPRHLRLSRRPPPRRARPPGQRRRAGGAGVRSRLRRRGVPRPRDRQGRRAARPAGGVRRRRRDKRIARRGERELRGPPRHHGRLGTLQPRRAQRARHAPRRDRSGPARRDHGPEQRITYLAVFAGTIVFGRIDAALGFAALPATAAALMLVAAWAARARLRRREVAG